MTQSQQRTPHLVDIQAIVQMLSDRIDGVVTMIFPQAVKEGPEWRIGSLAGERGRSMAIHRGGAKAGVWADFSSDRRGDALDLVAYALFGGDKARAVSWSKSFLGIDQMDPDRLEQVRVRAKNDAARKVIDAQRDDETRRKNAFALWSQAHASIIGTPVEAYLRVTRCIDLDALPRISGALRFSGAARHPSGDFYPAMMAGIFSGQGEFMAVHRTFLHVDETGRVDKARVGEAKLVLGSYRGGFIPLCRGPSGKPLGQAPSGDRVVLCEGIEDGLSLAMILGTDYRILAAIGVSNFHNIRLPETVREVIIAADNDGAGTPAAAQVANAERVFLEQGREVRIVYPRAGAKDFNDMLRQRSTVQVAS